MAVAPVRFEVGVNGRAVTVIGIIRDEECDPRLFFSPRRS
jgi:hypothetical protein